MRTITTRTLLVLALINASTMTFSQTPAHQGVVYNQAGSSSSLVNSVAIDGDGNLVACGYRSDALDFGGAAYPQGAGAVFIAKFDPQGTELWSKVAGSADQQGNHKGMSVAVDGSGNIYCAGWLFAAQAAVFDGTTLPIGSFGFVAKYTNNGTMLWVKDYAGGVNAIAVDGNGNPFINLGDATIEKLDPANGNSVASAPGSGDLQNVGNHNIVIDADNNVIAQWGNKITKHSNDLAEEWSTPLVKPFGSAESFRITVDGTGNVWATFYALFGTVTLGGTDYTSFPAGYIYNLDGATGTVLSAVTPGAYKIKKVFRDAGGDIYALGNFAFNDPYVVKYNASLTALWSVLTFDAQDMTQVGVDCFVLGGAHDATITLDGATYDRPNNSGSDNAIAGFLCAGSVSIEEHSGAGYLHLFPNPTSASIMLDGAAKGTTRVFDAKGIEVLATSGSATLRRLDVSTLSNGLYLVRDATGRSARFQVVH